MSLALMMVLQGISGQAGAGFERFDLKKMEAQPSLGPAARRSCVSNDPNEIIVCGSRSQAHRVQELPNLYETKPPVAEVGLPGGATGRVRLDQVELQSGIVSRRVMFTITKPF